MDLTKSIKIDAVRSKIYIKFWNDIELFKLPGNILKINSDENFSTLKIYFRNFVNLHVKDYFLRQQIVSINAQNSIR